MYLLGLNIVAIGLFFSANAFPLSQEWNDFKRVYGKRYETQAEEETRFNIFLTNKVKVEEHNRLAKKGKYTFNMKLNEFADQSHEEFLTRMNLDKPLIRKLKDNGHTIRKQLSKTSDIPDAINWHDLGCVLSPSDTETFACSWPFVSAGALEGQWCATHHVFTKLSEQNLLDCVAECSVGTPDDAYEYCVANSGVDTAASYPFTGNTNDTCKYTAAGKGVLCNGVVDIPSQNETTLHEAVGVDGPVSVFIDGSQPSFQFYTDGVYYDDACSTVEVNLLLLVAGYNVTEDGQEYWTARNQWGTSWGEDGFILLARNRNNSCGIATDASYPKTAFC